MRLVNIKLNVDKNRIRTPLLQTISRIFALVNKPATHQKNLFKAAHPCCFNFFAPFNCVIFLLPASCFKEAI